MEGGPKEIKIISMGSGQKWIAFKQLNSLINAACFIYIWYTAVMYIYTIRFKIVSENCVIWRQIHGVFNIKICYKVYTVANKILYQNQSLLSVF